MRDHVDRTMASLARSAAMALAIALAAAAGAWAEEPRQTREVTPVVVDESAPAAASSMVAIDPATGEVVPPAAAEAAAIADGLGIAAPAAKSAVRVTTLPDGTLVADLAPSLMNVLLVHINPDGSVEQKCVEGLEAAASLVSAGTTPAQKEK